MNTPVIEVKNVSKKYFLREEKKQPTLAGRFFRQKTKEFWALKDINFSVTKGEWVGILGSNGAGKSTLLKIIAGITVPTRGKIATSGKIVSLLNLRSGFNMDLSGNENIFLNGLLLGMRKRYIKKNLKEIVEFSGLRKFINSPLYTYSEGMTLRLGISVALHSEVDILLADDVGAYVFDEAFHKKMDIKRYELRRRRKLTEIMCTHKPPSFFNSCSRIFWISEGEIKYIGKPSEIIPLYQKENSIVEAKSYGK